MSVSRAFCSDSGQILVMEYCLVPGSTGTAQASDPGNYTGTMMLMAWMMVALVLYFMRPNALRRRTDGKGDHDRGVSATLISSYRSVKIDNRLNNKL